MTALLTHLRYLIHHQRAAILAGDDDDVDTWTVAILKVVGEMEELAKEMK